MSCSSRNLEDSTREPSVKPLDHAFLASRKGFSCSRLSFPVLRRTQRGEKSKSLAMGKNFNSTFRLPSWPQLSASDGEASLRWFLIIGRARGASRMNARRRIGKWMEFQKCSWLKPINSNRGWNDDYRRLRLCSSSRVFIFDSFTRLCIEIYNCPLRPRRMNYGVPVDEFTRNLLSLRLLIIFFAVFAQLQATEVIHPPRTRLEASVQILQTTTTTTATDTSSSPSRRRRPCSYKRRRRRPNSHIIY